MIHQTDTGFEIRCDWVMCNKIIHDETVQLATNAAKAEGWEKQIKRMGNGQHCIFDLCPEHAKRGREFDTEGRRIEIPKLFQKSS